jgi:hypothetical protein
MERLYKVNWILKHPHGDWSQIPAKRVNTKSNALLQTPAKRRFRQATITCGIDSFVFLATRVATVKV